MDVILEEIIGLATVAAIAVLVMLWRTFRSNKRSRIIIIALISAGCIVFAIDRFGGWLMYKFYNPEMRKRVQATADFIEDNRERIAEANLKIDSLKKLVGRTGWLPAGEMTSKGTGRMLLLLWAHHLRGAKSPDFPEAYNNLWRLEEMVGFAADPESIDVVPTEWMTEALEEIEAPLVIVAQLDAVTRPDPNNGEFGKTKFSVAVVDMKTNSISAHGRGEAAGVRAASDLLVGNLWTATNKAARALAERLMPQSNQPQAGKNTSDDS